MKSRIDDDSMELRISANLLNFKPCCLSALARASWSHGGHSEIEFWSHNLTVRCICLRIRSACGQERDSRSFV